MSEELSLVAELAIILISAGLFTIISKVLKQPLILGYIVAGFIIGPYLGIFPQFSVDSVHQWSEIGIIFLMFGLGLEFSFKKLVRIGSSALITSLVICIGMFFTGMVLGNVMNWTMGGSLFLGGLMSMSSTTIIIKAYSDMGLKSKPYASLIFGTLVFEDLIAVLLMVLLPTLAASNQFAGSELLMTVLKLVFFLVLWFLVGLFLIPTLLKKAKKYLSDEIILVVGVGLCFGMVYLANFVGFSSALGAFVMGSILAETVEGERILKVTGSIKDLFGAVFFVSVGMMLNPAVFVEHWRLIIVITLAAVFGIMIFSIIGTLLAGKGLDTAVHVGFTLPQLGEFSFILASLGCSLGVFNDYIYPVVICVSVITTFTTPYFIRLSNPVSSWLYKVLPASLVAKLDPKETEAKASRAEKSLWKKYLEKLGLRMFLYIVILIAILSLSHVYLKDLLSGVFTEKYLNLMVVVITLLVMLPFLMGIISDWSNLKELSSQLMRKGGRYRWYLRSVAAIRYMVAVMFVVEVFTMYFNTAGWSLLLVAVAALAVIILERRYSQRYSFIEKKFIDNLNAREILEKESKPVSSQLKDKLMDYNIDTRIVSISPDFKFIGKSLREMPFRKTTGVNILKVTRRSRSIINPSGDEPLYPGDSLVAVGTGEQLDKFVQVLEDNTVAEHNPEVNFAVDHIGIDAESPLLGKSLRQADLRSIGCMVVSVINNGKVISNPDADYVFEEGDLVWMAGEKESLNWLKD
ncbi:MAG: cation:proton antiporter [Bacteroidales bacterium]|nr:cation:proton antiporter [Bacteroidales bacterium]